MNKVLLSFVGDIMPGGVLQGIDDFVDTNVLNLLNTADFRIGTLECAFGSGLDFDPVKMKDRQNVVYTIDEDISKLKKLNIDIVTIANNHIYDLGVEGLKNVIHLLEKHDIKYCGAGLNYHEASKPVIIEKGGVKVAFIGYCALRHVGYIPIASENEPGVALLDSTVVCKEIKRLKMEVDFVVVLPHWGEEGVFWPHTDLIQIGKEMIDAGADAIVGSHSHQVQPVIKHNGKPIFFSLGNFLFPDFYMEVPRPIFYPTAEEIAEITTVTHVYPFPIKERMKMVWPEKRRVGMIGFVELSSSEHINFSYQLSELSTSIGKIVLANNKTIRRTQKALRKVQFAFRFNYNFFWKLMRLKNRILKRLAIIFNYETEIY